MHLGKRPERRQDPDSSRTARRHDHGQRRRQAAPPATQAGSTEDPPRPRKYARQADPPRVDSGPTTTTDHRHPGTASARHDRQQDRGHDARPRYRPRQQDRPTARHSAHSAPTADAPPRRPTTATTPPRTPTGPATRPRWTGGPTADRPRPRPAGPTRSPPTVHELNRNRTPRSPRQKSRKCLKFPIDNQENI